MCSKYYPFRNRKYVCYFLCAFVFLATLIKPYNAKAGSGIYESYAIINSGSGNTLYDFLGATPDIDFDGFNFGAYETGSAALILNGGQVKTFMDGADNICGGKLFYSVYAASGSPVNWNSIDLNFNCAYPDCGNVTGDQTWDNTTAAINLLAGLLPGSYKVSVYVTLSGGPGDCSQDPFITVDNGGLFWTASFTVTGAASFPVTVSSTGGTSIANYADLGSAFAAINSGVHTGTVNILITGNTTESSTAVLNASGDGNASYTNVLINPYGAVIVSGDIASEMIVLNGADNVVTDGLNNGGNSLTIQNISTGNTNGTSTIKFTGDAQNNIITNCTVLGSATVNISAGDAGGNIWFASGIVTGNDDNTISNCNIGNAAAGLPLRLIYSSGSAANDAQNNSGISISNCNLYDCFGAASVARMIDISSGSTDFTISGNRFYETDARVQSAGTEFRAISISNTTSGNNFLVTENTIGYSSSNSSGVFSLSGLPGTSFIPVYINTANSVVSVVSGNSISAINISGALSGTGSSAPFTGILVASGSGTVNISGNTIGAASGTGSVSISSSGSLATDVNGIYTASSGTSITGNIIGSVTAGSTASSSFLVFGIRANTSASSSINISSNNIGSTETAASVRNTTVSSSARLTGIQNDAAVNFTINSNIIANLSSAATNTSTVTPAVAGIRQAASSSSVFTGSVSTNTISSLAATDLSAGTVVTGIYITGSVVAGTSVTVSKNFIHSFSNSSSNSFAELRGINIISGTAAYQNNMIRMGIDADGNSLANNLTIYGIYEAGGSNSIYHNTVYVCGAGVTGSNKTYAFRSLAAGVTRIYKNNIFQNTRSGSGKHYAVQVSGSGINPLGLTSNNNLFFVSGSGGVLGTYGGVDRTTLAAWQTATGTDANSLNINPALKVPEGNSSSVDLHVDITSATTENNGAAIAGITTDIDNETRSASVPDIGADEYSLSPCSGANAGTISASANSFCNSGSAILNAAGYSNGTSTVYQWQYSNDNFVSDINNLSAASSAYSSIATGSISITTYYRLSVTCSLNSETAYSNISAITVNPSAASINASSTQICSGASVTLTENGGTANSWSWNPGGSAQQQIIVAPTATTIYTVSIVSAGGCNASASVTISVDNGPSGVTASSSASSVCAGSSVNLFSTANTASSTIFTENFNAASNSWIKTNNSAGGSFANAAWTLRPDNYFYSGTNAVFQSNDNSQFYLSNSDDQGFGGTTETMLESPAVNILGYTAASLSYFHHFSAFNAEDAAAVEISIDGGANWSVLQTFNTDQGSESSFVNDIISLNSYIGQSVKIRFHYTADFGNYWAIDNVSITGTPGANTFAWTSAPADFTSSLQNPTDVFPAANTTYTVTVTGSTGCSTDASTAVTISASVTYFKDNDGDGFGSANITQASCDEAPEGFVAVSGDCNDNNVAVHPGALEICNNIDDNCDGLIDETTLAASSIAGTIQCTGGTTTVTVSATGGITPYTGTGIFTSSAGSYSFTVTDAGGCQSATAGNIAAGTGKAPAKPGVISGQSVGLCGGGNFTYSVANVQNATSFIWTVPAGFSVVQNNGTSAVISVPAVFTTATISVAASNACGTSAARTLNLFAVAPDPSSNISGPSSVSRGQANVNYSVPVIAGVTYTWSVPSGSTITRGQGTNKIRVTFGNVSGQIKVTLTNACGSSPTGIKNVTVNEPLAAQEIYSDAKVFTGDIKAIPNPVQSFTKIVFNSKKEGEAYKIIVSDMNGKKAASISGVTIKGENTVTLNMSGFANAMYIVQLVTGENIKTLKLYKQK